MKFIETELGAGFLLIACGLPGTWKTETTEEYMLEYVEEFHNQYLFQRIFLPDL